MLLTDYNEKTALKFKTDENSIINKSESSNQFDDLLLKSCCELKSMSDFSALLRKTITHTDQLCFRSEQKNTYRNSDNVTQCVQTQKKKNAHSKLFNKLLNMTDRNTQISIKKNISSTYSD